MATMSTGTVVLPPKEYERAGCSGTEGVNDHEYQCRLAMAKRLAVIKGWEFGGVWSPSEQYPGSSLYFVPADSLLQTAAEQLPIRSAADLFGGVVPSLFATTKTLTHPLVDASALAPPGWQPSLPDAIGDAALHGFSVFDLDAAERAATVLLAQGPARIKLGLGVGGSGQAVLASPAAAVSFLTTIDPDELRNYGAVIEQNLEGVVTYSVGTVEVGGLCVSYYGTQRQAADHDGQLVYGGSDLHLFRGDLAALLKRLEAKPTPTPDPMVAQVVRQALRYDAAACAHLPGFYASRRNYDVAHGQVPGGAFVCGVLEQSWRIGGASPAEILALEAMQADRALDHVTASSHECHEAEPAIPPGAYVHYRGCDHHGRPLTKYAEIWHADAP